MKINTKARILYRNKNKRRNYIIATIQPVIKWTGSKRYLAGEILNYFPKEIDTYYEPFVGGGSVLIQLLQNEKIKVNRYVCSDINKYLIDLWLMIRDSPKELIDTYKTMWSEMNQIDDVQFRKSYYVKVRERFNIYHKPEDFLFLSRTATNGLIRFNSKGQFNSSYHLTRKGIVPETLEKIINQWSQLLNKHNVEFICCDYKEIKPKRGDFVYCDPPYINTDSMYFGEIDVDRFFIYLTNLKCKYIFNFNGKRSIKDTTYDVPDDAYSKHIYLNSGNSGFKKLQQTTDKVQESLYIS